MAMRSDQLETYKSRLVEMRSRLVHEVSQIEEAVREDANPAGEISSLRTHLADSNIEDVDRNVTMAENEAGLLQQVEAALERIQAGKYGTCQGCGKPIAAERLQALPYTPYCVRCAAQAEQDRSTEPGVT